jgi:hypothetical protein
MGKVFLLHAEQDRHDLPIRTDYERVVWAGLSWAAGEISAKDLHSGHPLKLTFESTEKDPIKLTGQIYIVRYQVQDPAGS